MNPNVVSLADCLPDATIHGTGLTHVQRVCSDSRQVQPGSIFVAVRGVQDDGHRFVPAAIEAGAAAVVVEDHQGPLPVPQAVVGCTARALGQLCQRLHGDPHSHLMIAGITGTNGKSTTAWLLRNILCAAGYPTGLLGTIEYSDGLTQMPAPLTTPNAHQQATLMSAMVRNGARHCVMEVSSHALQQRRCAGIQLAAGLITNITHDHLDYHQTATGYREAKAAISGLLHCDAPLLLNADDRGIAQLLREVKLPCDTILFGSQPQAELRYRILQETHRSQRLQLSLAQGDTDVRVRLVGDFNASNCLAAAALAEQLGMDLPTITRGLAATSCIPGRLERIDEGQPFQIYVDYAHTPDAMSRCLETVRSFTHGNLICVFGAGGDRDQEKRPLMAEAATAADRVVLTSDNPRHESPSHIINDILKGFSSVRHVDVDTDRREAIRRALEMAEPGDAVVLAGKGHEQSQVIKDTTLPFDDRQVARAILHDMYRLPKIPGPAGLRSDTNVCTDDSTVL